MVVTARPGVIVTYEFQDLAGVRWVSVNNHLICDLDHELRDDPVEDGAPVGEALLVLAACDAVEVPGGSRHHLVKQLHHNPAPALAVNGHIEKYPAEMDSTQFDIKLSGL